MCFISRLQSLSLDGISAAGLLERHSIKWVECAAQANCYGASSFSLLLMFEDTGMWCFAKNEFLVVPERQIFHIVGAIFSLKNTMVLNWENILFADAGLCLLGLGLEK